MLAPPNVITGKITISKVQESFQDFAFADALLSALGTESVLNDDPHRGSTFPRLTVSSPSPRHQPARLACPITSARPHEPTQQIRDRGPVDRHPDSGRKIVRHIRWSRLQSELSC